MPKNLHLKHLQPNKPNKKCWTRSFETSHILNILLVALFTLTLHGCATSTSVQSHGNNRYRVEGASEFGLSRAKDTAMEDAAKFCGSPQRVNQISSRNDSHLDIFGDRIQTWELIFQCGSSSQDANRTAEYVPQQDEPEVRNYQRERQVQAVTQAYDRCTSGRLNVQAIILACSEALRLDPRGLLLKPEARSDVLFNRSLAYARLQDYDKAIADMQGVLRAAPGDRKARNILADLRSDREALNKQIRRQSQPREPAPRGPERWEIALSAIANNTVHVNGRQIFKQKSGSNRINIGQFFKSGANTVVIRRKHVGRTGGQRAIFKRAGRTVLTLVPKDLQPIAMEFGVSKNLAKIQIQPEAGACWIMRGWGVINGYVQINGRSIDISGWEPCEDYRYLPPTPVVGHAMPLPPNPTKLQYLKAFYDYFKPLAK